jgi:D-tagatose-1,6-bisphosphate aldolase subunit GatZ/KbaZ
VSTTAPHLLDTLVAAQHAGRAVGVTSVCSAHPLVLDEALRLAALDADVVLVEATCNQVNQDGGYTGLTPRAFHEQLTLSARRHGMPAHLLVLGGDHLGPNPWKAEPAGIAMARSRELVAAYVAAGYTKIHLDTSMRCADDPPGALHPAVIAERSAELAVVAEGQASATGADVRYVVGTEVPVPGGESAGAHGIHVTTADDVEETLDLTQAAFDRAGVRHAWDRVRAVVAQPGVEFSDAELFAYHRGQAAHLARLLSAEPNLVLEAHSTDYQSPQALRALVEDRFAILKVGPELTFALREAVYALSFIEDELLGEAASHVRDVLDAAMRADPGSWQPFYPADPVAASHARRWSRSDRSRYSWPRPAVQAAVDRLVRNLRDTGLPDELVSQFLPRQHDVLRGRVAAPRSVLVPGERPDPTDLLRDAVRVVLDSYRDATGVLEPAG